LRSFEGSSYHTKRTDIEGLKHHFIDVNRHFTFLGLPAVLWLYSGRCKEELFCCSHKYQQIETYLFLNWRRKKIGPIYQELYKFLTPRIVIKLSKIWFGKVIGSRIRNTVYKEEFLTLPDTITRHFKTLQLFSHIKKITYKNILQISQVTKSVKPINDICSAEP